MKVVSPINVPFNQVPIPLRRKALKSVLLRDPRPFRIGSLFVFLVVSVIGVDQVLELADSMLEVHSTNLRLSSESFSQGGRKNGNTLTSCNLVSFNFVLSFPNTPSSS